MFSELTSDFPFLSSSSQFEMLPGQLSQELVQRSREGIGANENILSPNVLELFVVSFQF